MPRLFEPAQGAADGLHGKSGIIGDIAPGQERRRRPGDVGDVALLKQQLTRRDADLPDDRLEMIEFLVASFGNKDMQRLGDLAASTRVVDAKPEKFGRGTYSWQLVLTMLACGIILGVLVPVIIQTMSGQ